MCRSWKTNRRRKLRDCLRVAIGEEERLQFSFKSTCSNVQIASNVTKKTVPDMWHAVSETALCKISSQSESIEQITNGGPQLS